MKEFCERAFAHAGLDWKRHVEIDERYFRPAEVDFLLGDPTKARQRLGWKPKVDFQGLVRMMVDADLDLAGRELALRKAGYAGPSDEPFDHLPVTKAGRGRIERCVRVILADQGDGEAETKAEASARAPGRRRQSV